MSSFFGQSDFKVELSTVISSVLSHFSESFVSNNDSIFDTKRTTLAFWKNVTTISKNAVIYDIIPSIHQSEALILTRIARVKNFTPKCNVEGKLYGIFRSRTIMKSMKCGATVDKQFSAPKLVPPLTIHQRHTKYQHQPLGSWSPNPFHPKEESQPQGLSVWDWHFLPCLSVLQGLRFPEQPKFGTLISSLG